MSGEEDERITSWQKLRVRLGQKLAEWPEGRKHEFAMEFEGKRLTWWKLAQMMYKEKKISKVKRVLKRAEEVGLV